MNKKISILFFLILILAQVHAQKIPLSRALKISKSVTIKKGIYPLSAYDDLDHALIYIQGNDITIDFNGAILKGSNGKYQPHEFYGTAIFIHDSKNVTIKNLTAKGYKVALLAKNVAHLTLENCDFSYNYQQHLNSTQEKEDISDWMSYHHNEKDEWLRYGAAIYLRGCNQAIISNCKVTGGQNALMMTECDDALIYNNNFSFNSGIGLGLYRCNRNKVLHNKLDFNVRGYSHGVYNRGQDSAGILVYEQSNHNLFYKNSATHCGDGFFLWAGQTTMDTGQGGCNDNILLQNDFSYAPTNGVEATFSRNKILRNRIFECDNGIWGGYSFNSEIANNQFRNNDVAIAIEQGQENRIHHNLFYLDKEVIKLWARKEQPADWGYVKYRDVRSRNYILVANSFNDIPLVYDIKQTDSLVIFDNRYTDCEALFQTDSTVTNLSKETNEDLSAELSKDTTVDLPDIKNPIDLFKGMRSLAGRKNILMTKWGPYNFQYPIIWNSNPADTSGTMQFDILGPKGNWKIISAKGIDSISAQNGTFPAKLTAKKIPSVRTDIQITAEYIGPSFINQSGTKTAANQPYRFSFKKFFQPVDFTVKWYRFDSTHNPVKYPGNIAVLQKGQPFKTEKVNKLDYAWWGGVKAGQQYPQFLTIAEGKGEFIPGTYQLSITWDDAVKIYIDDKLVLDKWDPFKYNFDEDTPNKSITLKLSGPHTFRVEHVGLGGFATLSLKLDKVN